jgi:hypothetical protein
VYLLVLNERDHFAMADIATRSVRTVAREVIVPTIVCYFKGSGDACVALTWTPEHREAAKEHGMNEREGACFSPKEIYAAARAAEEGVEPEHMQSWVLRKRTTKTGMWLLHERDALASKPKIEPGSKSVPRFSNARGFAWPAHESEGITIGGLLAYFRLVPYLCVFPDEPMRVRPDPE